MPPNSGLASIYATADPLHVGVAAELQARLRDWAAAYARGWVGYSRYGQDWRQEWSATGGLEARW